MERKYVVNITEVLERTIIVGGANMDDAVKNAKKLYSSCMITLDWNNLQKFDISIEKEADKNDFENYQEY